MADGAQVTFDLTAYRDAVEDGIDCPECGAAFDEDAWDKRTGYGPGHAIVVHTCPSCERGTVTFTY